MPYKGGLSYEDVRTKRIRKGLKNKDISSILWQMLQDCFEDINANKEPRYGKTAMTFCLAQLSQMESKKTKGISEEQKIDVISGWLERAA
jgi:hypothetical protein